ncbi:DcrB-related protein [Xanthomonas sp. WHRI 1810A]|uniref:DcrB-related protein n=1 Tax=Xanthomonas sp. WHRI 1810A TaxID=3161565 RepID=UPI0032E88E0F
MSDTLSYRLNECRFALPHSDVQDASINILKFAESGTSLIVSRSMLAKGETLRGNFDGQLKRLEQSVQALQFQPFETVFVGEAGSIEALELLSQFSKASERVFQYQLVLVVPGTRQMLALSYVKAEPLGEADAAHWAAIKGSLRFEAVL